VTESAVGDTDAKEGPPPSGCDIHGATSNVRLTSILLKTPCCDASTGIWGAVTEAKLGLSALCGEDRRRKRDDLRHFPEVLGGDGQ
jgi:hypothetical protein